MTTTDRESVRVPGGVTVTSDGPRPLDSVVSSRTTTAPAAACGGRSLGVARRRGGLVAGVGDQLPGVRPVVDDEVGDRGIGGLVVPGACDGARRNDQAGFSAADTTYGRYLAATDSST